MKKDFIAHAIPTEPAFQHDRMMEAIASFQGSERRRSLVDVTLAGRGVLLGGIASFRVAY